MVTKKAHNIKIDGSLYSDVYLYDFQSLEEFKKFITAKNRTSSYQGSEDSDYHFSGTHSMEEALELLKNGWAEGAQKIEAGLKAYTPKAAERQRSVYDVVGGNASVPRYLQGIPTSMIRQVRTPVKQKVVDIYADIAFGSSTSTDTIIQSCIKTLQEAQAMESTGTRTNIYVTKMACKNNIATMVRVLIKKSTERFSVLKMAFPMAHPSMLRRLMFACDEHCPELPDYWFPGYGYPIRGQENIDTFIKECH